MANHPEGCPEPRFQLLQHLGGFIGASVIYHQDLKIPPEERNRRNVFSTRPPIVTASLKAGKTAEILSKKSPEPMIPFMAPIFNLP